MTVHLFLFQYFSGALLCLYYRVESGEMIGDEDTVRRGMTYNRPWLRSAWISDRYFEPQGAPDTINHAGH